MNAHSPVHAAATHAALNFLRPMRERPVSWQYPPPPASPSATASTSRIWSP